MCYNLTVTKISIITHIVCSYLIYKRGGANKSLAIALIGIGSMQIAEFFIHYDKDANKSFDNGMNINKFGSLLGRYSLDVIQPIFGLISILVAPISKNLKYNVCIIWFVLFLYKIISVLLYFPEHDKFKTIKKQDCDIKDKKTCLLDWPWRSKGNIWIIYAILIVGLTAFSLKQVTFWSLFAIVDMILAYMTRQKIIRFYNASGSCFWGPLLGYILILTRLNEKVPELSIFNYFYELLSKNKIFNI
jgi:hypothetical protein